MFRGMWELTATSRDSLSALRGLAEGVKEEGREQFKVRILSIFIRLSITRLVPKKFALIMSPPYIAAEKH